jgi:transcriptional regulator NrdR family protein
MGLAVDVVKRGGRRQSEQFDADKLLRSIRAACLSVRAHEGEADIAARKVTGNVILWLENKPVVTSHDLRRLAVLHLNNYHPEAAYIYKHHRHII